MSTAALSTDIAEYLRIVQPDGVFEARIFNCPNKKGGSYKRTSAGWFFDSVDASKRIAEQERLEPPGIYITINPVIPDLLAWGNQRFEFGTDKATSDKHVVSLRRLLVDIDPKGNRPTGASSTDEEMQLALQLGEKVRSDLATLGWPAPLYGCSGNGCYLIYGIDLPNDGKEGRGETLLKNVLATLASKYNSEFAVIDTSTFNASRIAAVLGTWKRKGENLVSVPGVVDRPHRQSWFEPIDQLGTVPRELLEAMAAQAPVNGTAKSASTNGHKPINGKPQKPVIADATQLNDALRERVRLYMEKVPAAVSGDKGHTQTFDAASRLVRGFALSVSEAMPFLQEWNMGCRPMWDDRDLERKLEEARDKGREEIGRLLRDRRSVEPLGPESLTDTAAAKRFARMHRDDVRYCGPWHKWLLWDGRRWLVDESCAIDAKAKETAQEIWDELKAEIQSLDTREANKRLAYANLRSSAKGIASMVNLARSEPGVGVAPQDFDTDAWRINVNNGTLDLRSGQLRPHDRGDLITKLAPVDFDPAAACPRWLAFVGSIMQGNRDRIDHLQRLCGYWLTGSVQEHVLPILHGTGANGKSKFLETMMLLLGEYAAKGPSDLLLAKGDSHPTEKALLFGKRLVCCIETESGRRLAESLVKELTGGDKITARRMREDFWDFTPTHKLAIACNHRPVIQGTDHGIRRRIALIPFDVCFWDPDKETGPASLRQDKGLSQKLADELPGILNWCLEGCLAWQRDGLTSPDAVRKATESYLTENDLVAQWITEECYLAPDAEAEATSLWNAFTHWCKRIGEVLPSRRDFVKELDDRGFQAGRASRGVNRGRYVRRGVGLGSGEGNASASVDG